MVSIKTLKTLALSFPGAEELPHFEKTSFRIGKKIFATLSEDAIISVKFSLIDQSAFCAFDKTIIYPVPGKWGLQGWTLIELKKISRPMLIDVLTTAYCEVAPKTLAAPFLAKRNKAGND